MTHVQVDCEIHQSQYSFAAAFGPPFHSLLDFVFPVFLWIPCCSWQALGLQRIRSQSPITSEGFDEKGLFVSTLDNRPSIHTDGVSSKNTHGGCLTTKSWQGVLRYRNSVTPSILCRVRLISLCSLVGDSVHGFIALVFI